MLQGNLKRTVSLSWLCLTSLVSGHAFCQETRIKELVNIRGIRSNQLIGFGLVVGLSNTGDSKKSLMTGKAAANLLTRLGMRTTLEESVPGSVAAVVVTAELQPFSRNGDQIDLRLSTVGDAKSLGGGTLLWTPLRAGDSQVYAVGQGTIVIGQASGTGSQVQTVAVIPNGASVEREFKPDFSSSGTMLFSLKNADFTTNTRISDAINEHLRGFYARSVDPVSIEITIPESFRGKPVEFVSEIEGLRVAVDRKAVVVMNERTGTVVMGADVTIGMVTIAHGSLSIQVGAMGGSSGKSGAKSGGKGKDSSAQNVVSMGGTNVGKLVETLNALGVKPADLIGIMQAIHAAGALQAELRLL